ncbi:MAG: S8 family serine peptidase [Lewinella sp.]|nr:S8 family serine peptidase [Lewinella sp.]
MIIANIGFWIVWACIALYFLRPGWARVAQISVVAGLLLWAAGILTGTHGWSSFFGQAFLGLILMGFTSAALLLARRQASLRAPIVIGAWALTVLAQWLFGLGLDHSPVATTAPSIEVDASGELLVELRPSTLADPSAWEAWVAARGCTTRPAFQPEDPGITELDDYYLLDVPETANWSAIMAALEATDLADWVEPNEMITVAPSPARTVPEPNRRLGVNDPGVSQQWALDALQMDQLYQLLERDGVQPRKQALIAVLDTGVDARHEDLAGNYRSTKKDYDTDPRGHGTHCAGIIGAVTNNGRGIASYARRNDFFRITSIQVLKAGGSGTQQSVIAGMLEAADRGADVLSMSLGGFSTQSRQRAYTQAVEYVTKKGGIVVAAAGNSNRNATSFAPVNATGVIGVSAIDQELNRAVFSNYVGDLAMGLAAPGVGIYSTMPNNNYQAQNGTSMAAPYVSGVIGLMRSLRPELTARQAYEILRRTGKATRDARNTGPLIQPYQAVRELVGQ